MKAQSKRLFFGLEVHSVWPAKLPRGRILDESIRHLTLAFLGKTDWTRLQLLLPKIPKFDMQVGIAGHFDECLLLPPRHPRVVAWHINWLDHPGSLLSYRETLIRWLDENNFPVSLHDGEFLPHVTVSRGHFNPKQWKTSFESLPMFIKDFHLFESLGHSKYRSCWSSSLLSPFEEIEHTADVGYLIRGESIEQIYHHAQTALCFYDPQFLNYLESPGNLEDINDVIINLNTMVSNMDAEQGCSLKAVSFHGELVEKGDQLLEWEMIIDV